MVNWPAALRLSLVLAALFGLAGQVQAQLPPDERRQLRQEMRDHWQQLPPEEKQRFRQERRERRDTFQQMPAEDRSRLRDELRGQRDGRGEGRGAGPGGEHRGGGRH
jgi:hypothetical protein